jgi:hypothetical protein
MDYFAEGLEMLPKVLLQKLGPDRRYNLILNFDLTRQDDQWMKLPHYSPDADVDKQYISISIIGNPEDEFVREECIRTLNHEIVHYMALNKLITFKDYIDIMVKLRFKWFKIVGNNLIPETPEDLMFGVENEDKLWEKVLKYYTDYNYFIAHEYIAETTLNQATYISYVLTEKAKFLNSLKDRGVIPQQYTILPINNSSFRNFWRGPHEVIATVATSVYNDPLVQDLHLGFQLWKDTKHILEGNLLRVKLTTIGVRTIYVVFGVNEDEPAEGFVLQYFIDSTGKKFQTEAGAKAGIDDDAMVARIENNSRLAGIHKPTDHVSNAQRSSTGGIDLTANKTPLVIKNAGEGIKFHIDPAILAQLQNAPGFTPVIINIQSLPSIKVFLGLKEE